jgi:hypothetical protein
VFCSSQVDAGNWSEQVIGDRAKEMPQLSAGDSADDPEWLGTRGDGVG